MAMPMLCFQPLVARRIAANIAKLPELLNSLNLKLRL
jgi:hypothetical protein